MNNLWGWRASGWLGRIATFALVTIGWVFFRSHDLKYALDFLGNMSGVKSNTGLVTLKIIWTTVGIDVLIAVGLACAISFIPQEAAARIMPRGLFATVPQGVLAMLGLIYASSVLVRLGFNPFIYFQF
jgi:D-alanyl-lipoteichoic acid acyltransferase DltB (MBOAT superfamily)